MGSFCKTSLHRPQPPGPGALDGTKPPAARCGAGGMSTVFCTSQLDFLDLRGSASQMKQTLRQLQYKPDETAAGWDTVLIRMGMQRGEIPVYVLRQVGDIVLKAPPLKMLTVGQVLRLNVTAELNHLVQHQDVFSAKLAASSVCLSC